MTEAEMRTELGRCLDLFNESLALAKRVGAQPKPRGFNAMLDGKRPYTLRAWLVRLGETFGPHGYLEPLERFAHRFAGDLEEADRFADEPERWGADLEAAGPFS